MKDLKRDLDEEGIELLVNKEKNAEGFSTILDHLHKTFIHLSWPLSGLDDGSYNSDFDPPYSNFLNFNSSSCQLYVPYHTCYDDVICTREGLFVNSYIGNPHYFVEMHFFYTNAILSCRYPLGIETKQIHLLLIKVERRFVHSDGYQEMGSQNGRITSYQYILIKPRITRKHSSENYPFFFLLALSCKDIR